MDKLLWYRVLWALVVRSALRCVAFLRIDRLVAVRALTLVLVGLAALYPSEDRARSRDWRKKVLLT